MSGWGEYQYGVAQICKNCGEYVYVHDKEWKHYDVTHYYLAWARTCRPSATGEVLDEV